MLQAYFRSLYRDTMDRAYGHAFDAIAAAPDAPGSLLLDCGAGNGWVYAQLQERRAVPATAYRGIEWHAALAADGRGKGLQIAQGDLNQAIGHADGTFSCVYALSLLEHLLNPCHFLAECHRVLRPGGRLVLLTPNISTWFTAALILAGRMPSTGPHPDSNALLQRQQAFADRTAASAGYDLESDTPRHRHLVVFSYRVLRDYLEVLGFSAIEGRGFGVYPFPRCSQGLLERIDPWHAHQMVFTATR